MCSFILSASCLVFITTLAILPSQGNASPLSSLVPCPPGKTIGDSWEQDNCAGRCTCESRGPVCQAAKCYGIELVFDRSKCYTKPGTGPYPNCCMPRLVCRGERDFQESLIKQA